ncbi:MAG TPA: hypothetical protein VJB37_02870, partial [Patescibacteria group bacterium]|nr:hypothetical protein [Patescibacteria group bacterium]
MKLVTSGNQAKAAMGSFALLAVIFLLFFVGFRAVVNAYTWTTIVVLENQGIDYNIGQQIDLAVEDSDSIHFAYCESNNVRPHYTRIDAGVTSTPEILVDADGCGGTARTMDLDLDGTNTPIIVYKKWGSPTSSLYYMTRDSANNCGGGDTDWGCYTITDAGLYNISEVSFDYYNSATRLGVAFYDAYYDDLGYATCSSTCTVSTSWSIELVDTTGIVGTQPEIKFNSSGVPVIAYADSDNSEIKYAIRDGGAAGGCADSDWSCYTVDAGYIGLVKHVSLALDSSGQIGISYSPDGNDLCFAYQDGGNTGCIGGNTTFTCSVVSSTPTGGGLYTSLAFNTTNPIIAWHRGSTLDDLYLDVLSDGSWTEDLVTNISNDPSWPHIELSGNTVHLGYYGMAVADTNEAIYTTTEISFNTAPSASATSPYQSTANRVSVTTTVADVDNNEISLLVYYSVDGTNWFAAHIMGVSQGGEGDGVSTSTVGTISSIDTDVDGSVNLSFEWDALADLPYTEDASVYFRVTPNDGTDAGSAVVSPAFTLDTREPINPMGLSVVSTSTNAVVVGLGTSAVDTNFKEYKIFYSLNTPVTESDSAHTSSTDGDLGAVDFNGTSDTTISSLSSNTKYYAKMWAYDTWLRSSSTPSEISFYTLAPAPTNFVTTTITVTSAAFQVDTFNNHGSDSSGYYFQILNNIGTEVENSGWQSGDNTWSTSVVLTENTPYQGIAKNRNGNGIETAANSGWLYTLADTPTNLVTTTVGTDSASFQVDTFPNHDSGKSGYRFVIADEVGTWVENSGWQSGDNTWSNTVSLSSNTKYQVGVLYRNGDGVETATTTRYFYTLAPAPVSPTVSSIGVTSAVLSVSPFNNHSGDSSGYYFVVFDGAAAEIENSGWQSGDNTWSTSVALTENTRYQAAVKERNGDGVETSTTTAWFYTLADTPTNLATTTVGATSAAFQVDTFSNDSAGQSGYYFFIQTMAGAEVENSGWQSGDNTWSNTVSLSSNTKYQIGVLYHNGDSVETSTSTKYFYTLAPTPTNLVASTVGVTSAVFAVDSFNSDSGDSSAYFFTVYTIAGAEVENSGWQSGDNTWSTAALTANTPYRVHTKYRNGDSTETATSTLAFYTLSSGISSVSAAKDPAAPTSQIIVSWTGDGTSYYAEDVADANRNSGWTNAGSYTFTNLNNGTTYSFRVKAKNSEGIETAWSAAVSATTDAIAPAAPPPAPPPPLPPECQPGDPACEPDPKNPSGLIVINNGAAFTTSPNVVITFLDLKYVSNYVLSEDPAFIGLSFEPLFGNQAPFVLSAGYGNKTVYARLQGDNGTYDTFDVIEYKSLNDQDGDGVEDAIDNCPLRVNSDQADGDNDGLGDVCDLCPNDIKNDIDGDFVCHLQDNCPNDQNPNQADTDKDGV